MKLYILCGIGFSGKTTLSKAICNNMDNCSRICMDDYYLAIAKPFVKENLGREYETPKDLSKDFDQLLWDVSLSLSFQAMRDLLKSGKSVVFDDVSLLRSERDRLRELAKDCGAEPVVIQLNTNVETARLRQEENKLTKERHDVDMDNIQNAIDHFEAPTVDEKPLIFTPDDNLEKWLEVNIKT